MPQILIGFQKELLLLSKTKDNADHAGLSQPLEDLKVSQNPREILKTSLNPNSLTAQDLMETKPVTEV